MMDESLILIIVVLAMVYLFFRIVRDSEYYVRQIIRKHNYGFYRDPIYNKILGLLDELDSLEYRKRELRDAPNKLCNQNCTSRQKFLIKLYEENNQMLTHIQTTLLIQLNEKLKKLNLKYKKYYDKLKRKYNLPDDIQKWEAKLKQYG